uniref:Uncharacterized protein n=1 Tax=Anguilla anguilla TaxID=7936 RepID=A0A0E9X4W7_ANGAN
MGWPCISYIHFGLESSAFHLEVASVVLLGSDLLGLISHHFSLPASMKPFGKGSKWILLCTYKTLSC